MIAGYALHFKLRYQVPPHSGRISGEERLFLGGQQVYLAPIKSWPIVSVWIVGSLVNPCGCLGAINLAEGRLTIRKGSDTNSKMK